MSRMQGFSVHEPAPTCTIYAGTFHRSGGAEIASCELGSARRCDLGPVFARICAGVIVAGVVDVESSG
jgi:hypothetical protein